jgi:hypothetical protein
LSHFSLFPSHFWPQLEATVADTFFLLSKPNLGTYDTNLVSRDPNFAIFLTSTRDQSETVRARVEGLEERETREVGEREEAERSIFTHILGRKMNDEKNVES